MKTKILSLVAIVVLIALLIPGAVQASPGLSASSSSAQVDFPGSITFNLNAQSDVNITDIRLHYSVERADFAQVASEIFIDFNPAASVKEQYLLDLKQTGGFPPGTVLDFWWTLTDASGAKLTTPSQPVHIDDLRYKWQTLKQGMVVLYWYSGSSAFANTLMDTAQQALTTLGQETGVALKEPAHIYIYASSNDLQGAMIFSQDWTGGVTFAPYGIIAIGIGTDTASLTWGEGAMTHELTHLVDYQVTRNPYNDLPTWLDEGLAMYSEGPLDANYAAALYTAQQNDTLISVRSLTSPFSAYAAQAVQAYAESYSIVAYLVGKYGRDKMLDLLTLFGQGSGYDDALQQVYGFDMDGLNTLWQADLITATVN